MHKGGWAAESNVTPRGKKMECACKATGRGAIPTIFFSHHESDRRHSSRRQLHATRHRRTSLRHLSAWQVSPPTGGGEGASHPQQVLSADASGFTPAPSPRFPPSPEVTRRHSRLFRGVTGEKQRKKKEQRFASMVFQTFTSVQNAQTPGAALH